MSNTVIEANPCPESTKIAIVIPSAAQTRGKYYLKREAVRQTWVTDAKNKYNISVYFVLGLNTDHNQNLMIEEESALHNDIIQMNFIDSYYNLTLKMISTLRWVYHNCPNVEFVLKADDDVVINVDRLTRLLNAFETGITGYKMKEMPNRDPTIKWHIPALYYPSQWLPEYVYGGAYLMSYNIIGRLVNTIDNYKDYVLDIEDVFITGVIAEKAGIPRHLSPEFAFHMNCEPKNLCKMFSIIALVECQSGQQMKKFYNDWITLPIIYCSSHSFKFNANIFSIFFILFIITQFQANK